MCATISNRAATSSVRYTNGRQRVRVIAACVIHGPPAAITTQNEAEINISTPHASFLAEKARYQKASRLTSSFASCPLPLSSHSSFHFYNLVAAPPRNGIPAAARRQIHPEANASILGGVHEICQFRSVECTAKAMSGDSGARRRR